jgi:mono/diheme cytochrome c family protein
MNGLWSVIVVAGFLVVGSVSCADGDPQPESEASTTATETAETSVTETAETSVVERGEGVFEYWCATCHGRGPGMPGTIALQTKYDGEPPAALADRTDLTPGAIRFFVRNGVSIMPFFRQTEISDESLELLVAYLTRPR